MARPILAQKHSAVNLYHCFSRLLGDPGRRFGMQAL